MIKHLTIAGVVFTLLVMLVSASVAVVSMFDQVYVRIAEMKADVVTQLDRTEEFLSVEHSRIREDNSTSNDDAAYQRGLHQGLHMRELPEPVEPDK